MIEDPLVSAAVFAHVQAEYDNGKREACGLLVKAGGVVSYFPCRNDSTNPREQFRLNPYDRLQAEGQGEVIAVVHSHPDASNNPSPADQIACAKGKVPWVIVSYPDFQHRVIEPKRARVPYKGRQFQHGVVDCYTLIQDYYLHELGIALPDVERDDKWWEKGQNLYLFHLKKAGFVQVEEPQKYDGVLMAIGSEVPNHSGVYLGDDKILHHMAGRLSGETTFGGTYWQQHLFGFFRHRSQMNEGHND